MLGSSKPHAPARPDVLSHQPALSRRTLFLLILLLALIWFLPLNIRHLVPSDEGRYAEMAREMFVTGDWITPRYNGYKYFEKPPLQTWANALTFAWFGVGDWQARLYTALSGFIGVLLVGYTGARVFNPRVGLFAAVVLSTSPYWNLMGHYNTLDMGLSFWMELTLCALMLAQRPAISRQGNIAWMCLCWAGMAMAFLSKGLVGLALPGMALILYSLIARDGALWRRLAFVPGIAVFLILTLPWFLLVQNRNPDFFHFFFIVQQFDRYLTPDQHRPGPVYYFVPIIVIGFLPWISIAWRGLRQALSVPVQANGFRPVWLLLVWTVFIFVFFSASHSKLLSYVLPIAPSIALVLAIGLSTLNRAQWQRHMIGYAIFLLIAGVGATALRNLSGHNDPNILYREFTLWVYGAIAVAFVLTLLALIANKRTGGTEGASVRASVVIVGLAWLSLGTIAGSGHEVFGRHSSGVLLAPAVRAAMAELPSDTPFYSVNKLDHTMPFYIGHTMIMVQGADELQFGVDAEPQKWVPTVAAWITRWDASSHALALMGPDQFASLQKEHVPMFVVARDARRVIVSRTILPNAVQDVAPNVP